MVSIQTEVHGRNDGCDDRYFVIGYVDEVPHFTLECTCEQQKDDLRRELSQWSELIGRGNKSWKFYTN